MYAPCQNDAISRIVLQLIWAYIQHNRSHLNAEQLNNPKPKHTNNFDDCCVKSNISEPQLNIVTYADRPKHCSKVLL